MDMGFKEIGVTQKAQDDWLELLGRGRGSRGRMTRMLSECTPGYYNNEGQEGGLASQVMGHPRGPVAFFKYLKKWRNSGKFKGLEFR
jgi:cyclohexanone monooxygenase